MIDEELTVNDLDMIAESLSYTIRAFENYEYYPTDELKQRRIAEARAARSKVLVLKRRTREREA